MQEYNTGHIQLGFIYYCTSCGDEGMHNTGEQKYLGSELKQHITTMLNNKGD
jgi:hypothetical protein